jgi:error-prone DNA polymerase
MPSSIDASVGRCHVSSSYIELHAASAFSFLQGASLPEALVDRAADLGYSALALLDRDGVYGAPRFHKAALAAGVRPIIGAELTIVTGRAGGERLRPHPGGAPAPVQKRQAGGAGDPTSVPAIQPIPPVLPIQPFMLPVLCESQDGYRNLCRLVTRMQMRAPKGEGALTLDELEGSTNGLVVLAGRAALHGQRYGVGGLLDRLVGVFGRGNVYVELQRHFQRHQEQENDALTALASAFHVPTVATNGVRFATPSERPLFDVLTCIHHHTDLATAGRRLVANAERYLKPPADMADLFRDHEAAAARASWPTACSTRWPIWGIAFRIIRCRPARRRCRSCVR